MVVASDGSRNVFAQQIFTLKQNNMIPKAIFKKKFCSEKMRWKQGWQV